VELVGGRGERVEGWRRGGWEQRKGELTVMVRVIVGVEKGADEEGV
jgi:hypothetical protein